MATRAPATVRVDGDLTEFKDAFCTPIEYFHPDRKNRPAQLLYMWDDEAFYVGLRTLDASPYAPVERFWNGDAVEWYFDTRRGEDFRNTEWGRGSLHCFFGGVKESEIVPRFALRPGYLDAIPRLGVEVGARRTRHGLEVEFKLPWANFPDFQPRLGEVVGVDAELSYSEGDSEVDSQGDPRTYRSFVYGSPLSVHQPANQAKVQLVNRLEREHWKECGPVLMPMRVDTPWTQKTRAHVHGSIAMPPNHSHEVGRVVFRLLGLDGTLLGEYTTREEVLEADGDFTLLRGEWPSEVAVPGRHHVVAVVYDKNGSELTRVAPRLVSVNMERGY